MSGHLRKVLLYPLKILHMLYRTFSATILPAVLRMAKIQFSRISAIVNQEGLANMIQGREGIICTITLYYCEKVQPSDEERI